MSELPIPVASPATGPDPEADRSIAQRRFSARTRFELRRDEFDYELSGGGTTRTFTLDYASLSRSRERLTDRNHWWRNVGLIWMALGGLLAVMHYVETQTLRVPIWIWLGAGCYAVYHFRVLRYRIIPAERCNVMIIEDGQADAIEAELGRRRARQLRERFDYITPNEHFEQQRNRIHWLQKQGVLDANEVSARLIQLQTLQSVHAGARRAQEDDDSD